MQSSLMLLMMSCIKKDPIKYCALVDVHDLLKAMYDYYRDVDETDNAEGSLMQSSRGGNKRMSVNFNARLTEAHYTGTLEDSEEETSRVRTDTEESISISEPDINEDMDVNIAVNNRISATTTSKANQAVNEAPKPDSENVNYTLNNDQRRSLRWCIQSLITTVVENGSHMHHNFQCLLDFMSTCKDLNVLNEIAQMLLIFIVESGGRQDVIGSIVLACHGAEEFASFILRYVVHRPLEELRCTGIRIITHFYLRLNTLPANLNKLSLKAKRHGSNLVAMAVEKLQELGRGNDDAGLQRLQVCGGMALLGEIITSHAASSTVDTYAVLLEMLLTKPGDVSEVNCSPQECL